eukprot:235605_1
MVSCLILVFLIYNVLSMHPGYFFQCTRFTNRVYTLHTPPQRTIDINTTFTHPSIDKWIQLSTQLIHQLSTNSNCYIAYNHSISDYLLSLHICTDCHVPPAFESKLLSYGYVHKHHVSSRHLLQSNTTINGTNPDNSGNDSEKVKLIFIIIGGAIVFCCCIIAFFICYKVAEDNSQRSKHKQSYIIGKPSAVQSHSSKVDTNLRLDDTDLLQTDDTDQIKKKKDDLIISFVNVPRRRRHLLRHLTQYRRKRMKTYYHHDLRRITRIK